MKVVEGVEEKFIPVYIVLENYVDLLEMENFIGVNLKGEIK